MHGLLLPALLSAAVSLPGLAVAAEEAPGPEEDGRARGRPYLGAGLGTGGAELTSQGDSLGQAGLHLGRRPLTLRLGLEVGTELRPGLRLGLDVAHLRSRSEKDGIQTAARFTDLAVVLTWYPWRAGPFLRGGGGLAFLTWDLDSFGRTSLSGLGVLAALGWAFRLGPDLELTANVDVAMHGYGSSPVGRDAATTWSAWLGAGWY